MAYKKTLNLPKTSFPMQGDLSTREPQQLEAWREQNIYQKMVDRNQDGKPFLFHDGPPYANGHIHHGHILNKTLKDFVVKYRNMSGQRCEFVPGWDCHGLPIEHQVVQDLPEDATPTEIQEACRVHAQKYVDIQREEFKRMMIFADWDNPYLTMDYKYEAQTLQELAFAFFNGYIYQGHKPVYWDWDSKTALAEAEVEYQSFKTPHVYALFPFLEMPGWLRNTAGDLEVFVAIWTTTPWTLPANQAVAINPSLVYQLASDGNRAYILVKDLRESVMEACGLSDLKVLAAFKGEALVGSGQEVQHPMVDFWKVPLLPADFVTTEQGTGCVHIAPAHGQDDFLLGQAHNLRVFSLVQDDGTFKRDSNFPELEGEHIFRANGKIVQRLHDADRLLNAPGEKIKIERYPFGWRSKKPLIFRATKQWFISMDSLRDRALETLETVDWEPSWGEARMRGMLESRPDWCISRQRSWGVPIPVFTCRNCGSTLEDPTFMGKVASLIEEHGVGVWYSDHPETLISHCWCCGMPTLTKGTDILDVWFDSGVSWSAVLDPEGHGVQTDLYLEGSDQHRGWFQSSLLCSLMSQKKAPYKTCLTHGFIVDEKGHKFSKSSKNYQNPQELIDKWGAEVLRLWVASVDYRKDITFSEEALEQASESYRKIRNTFRFMLSNLGDFDPATDAVSREDMQGLDRWALHQVAEALKTMDEAYASYQFHQVVKTLVELMTGDLSSFYLDVTKDRLYCDHVTSFRRRSTQTAYFTICSLLVKMVAPILSFTSEEVWGHLKGSDSVFLQSLETGVGQYLDPLAREPYRTLLDMRKDVQKVVETACREGTLKEKGQAVLVLTAEEGGVLFPLIEEHLDLLPEIYKVSSVRLEPGSWSVDVEVSGLGKCPRCWNYHLEEGQEVCERCDEVLVMKGSDEV